MPSKWTPWVGFSRTLPLLPFSERIAFGLYIGNLLLQDLWFYITCIPFFLKLKYFYDWRPPSYIHRDIAYAQEHPRQRLDVFKASAPNAPVVLFVHGGAWGSGDKWQYALVGRFFAERGVTCVVVTYRTFPEGWVGDQVADVCAAMTWTFEHCMEFNGNPDKVIIMGHSAGAHLSCVAMMQRSKARQRLPVLFIGSVGVYDIDHHYTYEWWRGVSELSTMKQAFQGAQHFATFSPSRTLPDLYNHARSVEHVCSGVDVGLASSSSEVEVDEAKQQDLFRRVLERLQCIDLDGDRVSVRAGYASTAGGAGARLQAGQGSQIDGRSSTSTAEGTAEPSREYMLFPPFILQTSGSDATVPWHTTASFHRTLLSCGAPSRLLLYDGVCHGEFATDYMVSVHRDHRGPRFVPEELSGINWKERVYAYEHEPHVPAHVRDVMAITQVL